MPAKKSAINTLGQQMCTKVLVSWYTSQLNNIRGENLNSVQEFVKIQSWLLLIILECLHYQISLIIKFYNSIKSTDCDYKVIHRVGRKWMVSSYHNTTKR